MKTEKLLWMTLALLLLCALLLSSCGTPSGDGDGSGGTGDSDPTLSIDSLDKINYYAAKNLIASAERDKESESLLSRKGDSQGITLLSQGENVPFDSAEIEAPSVSNPAVDVIGFEDISSETMKITRAYYCVIRIDENDTFLANRVGTGRAELVITDLRIGMNPFAMLTVKNGDRYFSCLSEMEEFHG